MHRLAMSLKQLDKKGNNPATIVKWKVSDTKKEWISKVTLNMYHTNQGVHFQGGERNGNATTCSLAGNIFESMCSNTLKAQSVRISEIKEMLLKLDGRKKYGSQPTKKKNNKEGDSKFKCDTCHYQTVVKTELKRHMFLTHQKRPHPTTMKKVTFQLSNSRETKAEEKEAKIQSECLKCWLSFKGEDELECHDKTAHKSEEAVNSQDKNKLLNELWEENTVLLKTQADHKIYLEQMKIREQEMINNMTTMKADISFLIKDKEKVEVSYQEVTKCVADQQDIITKQNETIKVLKSRLTLEIENKSEPAGLRQRKTPNPTLLLAPPSAPSHIPILGSPRQSQTISNRLSQATPARPTPGTVPAAPEPAAPVPGAHVPVVDVPVAPVHEAPVSTVTPTPVEESEEEGWHDDWEGELIAQQRKRLDHVCKKCDKQLDNERIFRQHMKEHMKKDSQIVQCHYCDFMTNDAAKYLSHIGDMHSPKFSCETCGEEFSEIQKKIEHRTCNGYSCIQLHNSTGNFRDC